MDDRVSTRKPHTGAPDTFAVPASASSPHVERNVYRSGANSRIVGMAGTGLIYAVIAAGFFVATFTYVAPKKDPVALAVFDAQPLAPPEKAPPQEKQAPEPIKKEQKQPVPKQVPPATPSKLPIPSAIAPIPIERPRPPDPVPKQPEAPAPKTQPAPPAPQFSDNAADSWEGRVLAALNRKRRYPPWALSRREQGVPYVRIVMDREGKVLSTQLERSSGHPELDREATALPKRAAPLPKPPSDKPGETLELVVPIEYFIRR